MSDLSDKSVQYAVTTGQMLLGSALVPVKTDHWCTFLESPENFSAPKSHL